MMKRELTMEELEMVAGGYDPSSTFLSHIFFRDIPDMAKFVIKVTELMLSGDEDAGCL